VDLQGGRFRVGRPRNGAGGVRKILAAILPNAADEFPRFKQGGVRLLQIWTRREKHVERERGSCMFTVLDIESLRPKSIYRWLQQGLRAHYGMNR